uniref:Uncharacterized protein n=1 Tax=Syphacia muris TaxID=451379 RepID=A0A0N5ACX4_9BILA
MTGRDAVTRVLLTDNEIRNQPQRSDPVFTNKKGFPWLAFCLQMKDYTKNFLIFWSYQKKQCQFVHLLLSREILHIS